MQNTFDNWEGNGEYLEHYGIPGMKWGVRRFQNRDGTLTAKGEKRYGNGVMRRGLASTMRRHLNKLDAGYANVAARQNAHQHNVTRFMKKSNRAKYKGNEAKAEKYHAKAMKEAEKAAENNLQRQNIEKLQWKIIGAAARNGWTVNSTPVKRLGHDGKTTAAQILGGVAANAAYTAWKRGRNYSEISGQKFSVKRRGRGHSSVVNYAAARNDNVRKVLRDEEYRKQLSGAKRV